MAKTEIKDSIQSKDRIIPGLQPTGNTEDEAYAMFYTAKTEQIIYPGAPESQARIEQKVQRWKQNEVFWGMYTGVFDVTHPNHYWATIRARILVAKAYAESKGINFGDLDLALKTELVTSDKIALMVSVDGDEYVAARKAHKHGQVGTIRPVQPWGNRALNISNIMLPVQNGLYKPAADLITSHDIISYEGQIFESELTLGKHLKPNCWMVASSDPQNAKLISEMKTGARIMSLDVGTIADPLTNKPYSTSDTIARLMQG